MSGLVDELRTKFEMEGQSIDVVTMDGERVRIELPTTPATTPSCASTSTTSSTRTKPRI